MRRRGTAAALFGLAAIAAACGRSAFQEEPQVTTPPPSPSPTVTDTPIPTPTPPLFFGDGRDGALLVNTADVIATSCRPLLHGSNTTFTIASPLSLSAGDRVLLLQMQGSTNGSVTTPTAITTQIANGAGAWDVGSVVTTDGTGMITLGSALSHSYRSGVNAAAQACALRQYTSVTIGSGQKILAAPWDGATGGVVAFECSAGLFSDTANGSLVDVSGVGFRGGAGSKGTAQDKTAADTSSADGSGKGESINRPGFALFGRGARGNGGGGGDSRSAGGGGGGNGGAGGFGGRESDNYNESDNNRGVGGGGTALPINSAIFLGGGGGAGHGGGSTQTLDPGGAGGGIVFVRCESIPEFEVAASGARGSDGPGNTGGQNPGNGGGGGGAAGTVAIWASSATAIFLTLDGGDGGDTLDDNHNAGPGGGGAGGRYLYNGPSTVQLVVSTNGGANGFPSRDAANPYGSTAGAKGGRVPN